MTEVRGVGEEDVVHLLGGEEPIPLESEGQVLGDGDQIPIEQLGSFILTDCAVAHGQLQQGIGDGIDRWWGTVSELSNDEFFGLFHDDYLKLFLF
jgi:hypothetical protein